jgi:hypothetical protein
VVHAVRAFAEAVPRRARSGNRLGRVGLSMGMDRRHPGRTESLGRRFLYLGLNRSGQRDRAEWVCRRHHPRRVDARLGTNQISGVIRLSVFGKAATVCGAWPMIPYSSASNRDVAYGRFAFWVLRSAKPNSVSLRIRTQSSLVNQISTSFQVVATAPPLLVPAAFSKGFAPVMSESVRAGFIGATFPV